MGTEFIQSRKPFIHTDESLLSIRHHMIYSPAEKPLNIFIKRTEKVITNPVIFNSFSASLKSFRVL